jgi:hypothetical protein
MRRGYALLIATVAGLMVSGPAQADCASPPSIDTCLVGSWKQTGGGAAEWMRQNLKMVQPTAAPNNGTLTFNADGTFSTSKVDSKAEVTAGHVDARDRADECASERDVVGGGWHAYAVHGLRRLEGQHRDRGTGRQEDARDGRSVPRLKLAMPQMKPANTSMTYTCAGATLSTNQPRPKNSTLTTSYARVP